MHESALLTDESNTIQRPEAKSQWPEAKGLSIRQTVGPGCYSPAHPGSTPGIMKSVSIDGA